MKQQINLTQVFGSGLKPYYEIIGEVAEQPSTSIEIPEISVMTDYGNSIRFINENRTKTCYCTELGTWALWCGTHWQIDTSNRILRVGNETILKIEKEADDASTHERKTELLKFCKKCQSPARVGAMLQFAAPELAKSWATMDTDPYLLNVLNGTIDLRSGQLMPHDPAHMNSKIAPVTYDPDAHCPRLLAYLESAFPGKPEMIQFLQKVFGYVLTGDVSEKCFFIFYGPGGNNGKSVLINVMRHILGPYALQTPVATLQCKKPGGNSNDIVRLKGARFVAASEIDPRQRYKFDEALLKMLTGNDPVAARELFKEYIEYYPEFKLFIGTNHQPEFNTADEALMDRVMTIPFMVSFPRGHDSRDENLLSALKAESSGVLNWLLKGCLMWQEERLGPVPEWVDIQLTVKETNPEIDRFLEEQCERRTGAVLKCGMLYDFYTGWCSSNGLQPAGNAIFSRHLKDRHNLNNRAIGSQGFHWYGVALKDDAE